MRSPANSIRRHQTRGALPRPRFAQPHFSLFEGSWFLSSTRQLEEAIRHYLDISQPFALTRSADEILASLERFCARV
jgi:hypothetical protein